MSRIGRSLSARLERIAEDLFRRLPASVRRHGVELSCRSLEEVSYRRLSEMGFRPAGIVDVGAFRGDWTRFARAMFPEAPVLMVEARETQEPELAAVCAGLPNVQYVLALLGGKSGEAATFYEMGTGSSLLPEKSNVGRTERRLTTRSLDEVAAHALPRLAPLLIKIDVQGAELEVLKGGAETLARTEIIQLEVALLPYNAGAPTMLEVLSFMDERGFVPFDISGFVRPNRRDLAQIDLLFVRRESALRPDSFTF